MSGGYFKVGDPLSNLGQIFDNPFVLSANRDWLAELKKILPAAEDKLLHTISSNRFYLGTVYRIVQYSDKEIAVWTASEVVQFCMSGDSVELQFYPHEVWEEATGDNPPFIADISFSHNRYEPICSLRATFDEAASTETREMRDYKDSTREFRLRQSLSRKSGHALFPIIRWEGNNLKIFKPTFKGLVSDFLIGPFRQSFNLDVDVANAKNAMAHEQAAKRLASELNRLNQLNRSSVATEKLRTMLIDLIGLHLQLAVDLRASRNEEISKSAFTVFGKVVAYVTYGVTAMQAIELNAAINESVKALEAGLAHAAEADNRIIRTLISRLRPGINSDIAGHALYGPQVEKFLADPDAWLAMPFRERPALIRPPAAEMGGVEGRATLVAQRRDIAGPARYGVSARQLLDSSAGQMPSKATAAPKSSMWASGIVEIPNSGDRAVMGGLVVRGESAAVPIIPTSDGASVSPIRIIEFPTPPIGLPKGLYQAGSSSTPLPADIRVPAIVPGIVPPEVIYRLPGERHEDIVAPTYDPENEARLPGAVDHTDMREPKGPERITDPRPTDAPTAIYAPGTVNQKTVFRASAAMSMSLSTRQQLALKHLQVEMGKLEDGLAEIYAKSEKRTFNKYGLDFEYAVVAREDFPYMVAIGSAGICYEGMRFVMKDFFVGTPEEQGDLNRYIEFIAVHEFAESIFQNHHQASMVEFAVAMKKGVLPQYMEFLDKRYFLKFRDVSLFRMGRQLTGRLAKVGIRLQLPHETEEGRASADDPQYKAALQLKDGFEWPQELKAKYGRALNENKEAIRETINRWVEYITVNEQTKAYLRKALDAIVRDATSPEQAGLTVEEKVARAAAIFYKTLGPLGYEFREGTLDPKMLLDDVAGTSLIQTKSEIRRVLGSDMPRALVGIFGLNMDRLQANLGSISRYMGTLNLAYTEPPQKADEGSEYEQKMADYQAQSKLRDEIRLAMLRRIAAVMQVYPGLEVAKAIDDEITASAGSVREAYVAASNFWYDRNGRRKMEAKRATLLNYRFIREKFRLALVEHLQDAGFAEFSATHPFEAQAIVNYETTQFDIMIRYEAGIATSMASLPTRVGQPEFQTKEGDEEDWSSTYDRYLNGELNKATSNDVRRTIIDEMAHNLGKDAAYSVQSGVDKGLYGMETAIQVLDWAYELGLFKIDWEKPLPAAAYFKKRYGTAFTPVLTRYAMLVDEFATRNAKRPVVWEALARLPEYYHLSKDAAAFTGDVKKRGYDAVKAELETQVGTVVSPAFLKMQIQFALSDSELIVELVGRRGFHMSNNALAAALDRHTSIGIANIIAADIIDARGRNDTKRLEELAVIVGGILKVIKVSRSSIKSRHDDFFDLMLMCYVCSKGSECRLLHWADIISQVDIEEVQRTYPKFQPVIGRNADLGVSASDPLAAIFRIVYDAIELNQRREFGYGTTGLSQVWARQSLILESERSGRYVDRQLNDHNKRRGTNYQAPLPLKEDIEGLCNLSGTDCYEFQTLLFVKLHIAYTVATFEANIYALERILTNIRNAIDKLSDPTEKADYRKKLADLVFFCSVLAGANGLYYSWPNRFSEDYRNFGKTVLVALIVDELDAQISSGHAITTWTEARDFALTTFPFAAYMFGEEGLYSLIGRFAVRVLSRPVENDPKVKKIKEQIN